MQDRIKGGNEWGLQGRTGLMSSVFGLICSAKIQISWYLCKGFFATFNLVACISGDSEKPASRMRFWGNYRSGINGNPNSWLLIRDETQALYRGPEKRAIQDSKQCLSLEQCNCTFVNQVLQQHSLVEQRIIPCTSCTYGQLNS